MLKDFEWDLNKCLDDDSGNTNSWIWKKMFQEMKTETNKENRKGNKTLNEQFRMSEINLPKWL